MITADRPARRSALRGVWRRDVLAICAVVFCGDLIAGIVLPSFSLFAESLGASVVFIGTLTTLSGVTLFGSSIPVGLLSDRVGRRRVLVFGMLSFAAAMTLLALAPDPVWLVPGRLLLGVAMVATFWIASAQMGDVAGPEERPIAFGLMTTAMGIGFAIGPLLGGYIAATAGLAASYLVAAGIAVAGAGVVLGLVESPVSAAGRRGATRATVRQSLAVARNRELVTAAIGNVVTSVGFNGAVLTFFPLYVERLGVAEAAILGMFTVRAVASTFARLPAGVVAGAIGSRRLMIGVLVLELLAILGMGVTGRQDLLLLLLAAEGVAFGGYLTSAHAFIAEHTVPETRGAALGFYSMAGSIGGIAAPLGLGLVAVTWGLAAVFVITAGLILAGLVALVMVSGGIPVDRPTDFGRS